MKKFVKRSLAVFLSVAMLLTALLVVPAIANNAHNLKKINFVSENDQFKFYINSVETTSFGNNEDVIAEETRITLVVRATDSSIDLRNYKFTYSLTDMNNNPIQQDIEIDERPATATAQRYYITVYGCSLDEINFVLNAEQKPDTTLTFPGLSADFTIKDTNNKQLYNTIEIVKPADNNYTFTVQSHVAGAVPVVTVNGTPLAGVNGENDTYSFTIKDVQNNSVIGVSIRNSIIINYPENSIAYDISDDSHRTVKYNESATFTITPKNNYTFDCIKVNGETYTATAQNVTVGADGSWTVTTEKLTSQPVIIIKVNDPISVKYTVGNGYTIVGPDSVKKGDAIEFTVTPINNYTLNSIIVNGTTYTADKVTVGADGSWTVTTEKLTSQPTIVVNVNDPISVKYTVGNGYTIVGPDSAKKGDAIEFTVTVSKGYILDSIYANGEKITSYTEDANSNKVYTVTLSNLNESTTISVNLIELSATMPKAEYNEKTENWKINVNIVNNRNLTYSVLCGGIVYSKSPIVNDNALISKIGEKLQTRPAYNAMIALEKDNTILMYINNSESEEVDNINVSVKIGSGETRYAIGWVLVEVEGTQYLMLSDNSIQISN